MPEKNKYFLRVTKARGGWWSGNRWKPNTNVTLFVSSLDSNKKLQYHYLPQRGASTGIGVWVTLGCLCSELSRIILVQFPFLLGFSDCCFQNNPYFLTYLALVFDCQCFRQLFCREPHRADDSGKLVIKQTFLPDEELRAFFSSL